jgi:hypothetical protein
LDRLAVQREDGARVRVVEHRLRPVRVVAPSGHRVAVLDGLIATAVEVLDQTIVAVDGMPKWSPLFPKRRVGC